MILKNASLYENLLQVYAPPWLDVILPMSEQTEDIYLATEPHSVDLKLAEDDLLTTRPLATHISHVRRAEVHSSAARPLDAYTLLGTTILAIGFPIAR